MNDWTKQDQSALTALIQKARDAGQSPFEGMAANVIDLSQPLQGASAGSYIKGQIADLQVLDTDGEVKVRADKDGKAIAKTQECVLLAVRVPTEQTFSNEGYRYNDGVRQDKKTGQKQSWFSKSSTLQSPYNYAQKWVFNFHGKPVTVDLKMTTQKFQNVPFEDTNAPKFGTSDMKHAQHQANGEVIVAKQDKYEEPANL